MQFSCESCKATLHIGDEKVKGKRLVVRCKKCGARIQIADPALGPPPAGAAALTAAPPVETRPIPTPEKLKPTPKPVPRVEREPEPGDSDTDSTQAMDSGVLEQALRASKADDSTMHEGLARLSNAKARSAAPAPDPQIWFAMIAGKQTGPMSRAELAIKVSQAQVTGRTYLWRETMAGWQRANDVAEVSALFAPPPSRPPAPAPTLPPPPPPQTRPGVAREPAAPDMTELRLGESPLSEEQRRGRQRVQPSFAKKEARLELEDSNISSSSGIEIPLDAAALGEHAPPRITPPQKLQPAPAPTPTPSNPMHLAGSLFSPEREMPRDPLAPPPEADDDDRTHVEPLPLGERVHQEAVAKELFTSSSENSPVGPTAKELASWASKEIGKKLPSQPRIAKAPVPSNSGSPRGGTLDVPPAGLGRPGAENDPFDNIPHAPGFVAPDAADSTSNIILRTGVKKSRAGTLVALFGGVIVVLVVLVIALSSGKELQQAAPEAVKKQLGGTGESVDGLVKGTTSGTVAAPAVDGKAQPRKVALGGTAPAPATPAPDPAKPAPATPPPPDPQQNAQALAALDTDRVGNHGPKSDATTAAPDTAKADSSLSADDIKKKLNENKGALQSCIDEALRKEPNLRVGKIYVATTIAPSGVVTNAKIDKAPVDESPLGACLKRATRRIVFPAFAGDEFEVDIPIVVTAGD